MRLVVTRTEPEAEATAERLRRLGHEAIVSPVMELEPYPTALDPSGIQALLITSAATVRILGADARMHHLPVLAVGDATALRARDIGFTDVRSANGDGAALADMAKAVLDPGKGMVVHAAGEEVATDVAELLRDAGFNAVRVKIYRGARAAALAPALVDALAANPPQADGVLFHSARGVEAFAALAREAGVTEACASLEALCLSQRVADIAKSLQWRRILVAPTPREDALLSLLQPA
jgi:uroporphyrinogen-III synthase